MATIAELERRIAKLERRLRDELKQRVANVAQVSSVTLTSTDGKGEGVDGRPSDESSQRSVRRMQHSGFRSRPLNQSDALFLTTEGGASKAVVVAEDDHVSVTLAEGEAQAYSPAAPACRIYFDKDGVLHIDADTNNGRDVIVNGGTHKVHRVNDHGNGGELVLVLGLAGGLPVFAAGTQYTDPDGTTHVPMGLPSSTIDISFVTKATEGADHLKA